MREPPAIRVYNFAPFSVACYSVFFSTPPKMLAWPVAVGAVAHALRWFVLTALGASTATGTFVACLIVGILIAPVSRRWHMPFAAIGKTKKMKLWPSGRFLDVRTLLWALRNKSYSLRSAAVEFKTQHQKLDHKPTGKVTIPEIRYAREDVACTVDLLNAAMQEFELHPIAAGSDRMFSPASVAKQYLEQLNIAYPSKKVTNANVNMAFSCRVITAGEQNVAFAIGKCQCFWLTSCRSIQR